MYNPYHLNRYIKFKVQNLVKLIYSRVEFAVELVEYSNGKWLKQWEIRGAIIYLVLKYPWIPSL